MGGDRLFGGTVSGFFGAIAMTPIALAIAGPLGLAGVTKIVGDPAAAGVEDLVEPLGSIAAIALGVPCGVTLFRGLIAVPTRLRGRPHHAR